MYKKIKSALIEWIAYFCAMLMPKKNQYKAPLELKKRLISSIRSVAVVVPHHDDEVIGTYHFLTELGSVIPIDLHYVTSDKRTNVARIRYDESMRAINSIKIRNRLHWGFIDGELNCQRNEVVKKIKDMVGEYDLILCPAPNDRTPDHAILGMEAYNIIPHKKLLWYRSTWWTFPLHSADFYVVGDARSKLKALREFKSQSHLALRNVITLSALEMRRCGIKAESAEAFRYASECISTMRPLNVLSIMSVWRIFNWK